MAEVLSAKFGGSAEGEPDSPHYKYGIHTDNSGFKTFTRVEIDATQTIDGGAFNGRNGSLVNVEVFNFKTNSWQNKNDFMKKVMSASHVFEDDHAEFSRKLEIAKIAHIANSPASSGPGHDELSA